MKKEILPTKLKGRDSNCGIIVNFKGNSVCMYVCICVCTSVLLTSIYNIYICLHMVS